MSDKYENLKQEAWQQVKYVSLITISLMTVLCLGYCTVFMTKPQFWVGVFFGIIALLFSLAWAVVILFIIRENKITHFRNWGDEWKDTAEKALEFLKTRKILESNIIFSSQKYFSLLEEARKSQQSQTINTPIQNIKFMGSMAGFFCFLPLSLRNHICATPGDVTIDIIGTGIKLDSSNLPADNLAIYPVAFVAKTIVSILEFCNTIKTSSRAITFNIYHFPYDIIEALYIIGDIKLVNLQALSINNIGLITEKDNEHVGLMLEPTSPYGQFNRYIKAYTRIQDELIKEDKFEKWKLTCTNNSKQLELTIQGKSYWTLSNNSIRFNDNLGDISITKNNSEVTDFLHSFYGDKAGIYRDKTSASYLKNCCAKIHEIDIKLRDRPDLSKVPCNCKWDNY